MTGLQALPQLHPKCRSLGHCECKHASHFNSYVYSCILLNIFLSECTIKLYKYMWNQFNMQSSWINLRYRWTTKWATTHLQLTGNRHGKASTETQHNANKAGRFKGERNINCTWKRYHRGLYTLTCFTLALISCLIIILESSAHFLAVRDDVFSGSSAIFPEIRNLGQKATQNMINNNYLFVYIIGSMVIIRPSNIYFVFTMLKHTDSNYLWLILE